MRERPILFSAPMVRAILAGAKTQTRRVVKPQPWASCCIEEGFEGEPPFVYSALGGNGPGHDVSETRSPCRCPYGQPGDRLWVREAYRLCAEADATPPRDTDAAYRVWYEADAPHQPGFGKLRPAMFMPRWASRITLEVTGVRVERLQDISTGDCWAEGIESSPDVNPLHEYCDLWESINGPGSWDANPWVWVVEFRRANEKTHRSAALGADHDGRVGAVGHSGAAA